MWPPTPPAPQQGEPPQVPKSAFQLAYFSGLSAPFHLTLLRQAKMKPEDALQEQIRRYRQMTGEQRLAVAFQLHELSCNLAREGIRRQNPQADGAEVERLLRQRLRLVWQ